ncbi:MAG TPA: hypothetical protein VE074_07060 [Jatrophihabitantaceae bacterium]|nr:hypothetical protein [Jatrophihabitantaceae bacterium]
MTVRPPRDTRQWFVVSAILMLSGGATADPTGAIVGSQPNLTTGRWNTEVHDEDATAVVVIGAVRCGR